jgi:hypothetical protein
LAVSKNRLIKDEASSETFGTIDLFHYWVWQ